MSDSATNIIPPRGLGQIGWQDVWKGLIKSCGGLILSLLLQEIGNKFQPLNYDTQIAPLLVAVVGFFAAYLGLNAATNNVGQLFQANKPVVPVAKKEYEELKAKADES